MHECLGPWGLNGAVELLAGSGHPLQTLHFNYFSHGLGKVKGLYDSSTAYLHVNMLSWFAGSVNPWKATNSLSLLPKQGFPRRILRNLFKHTFFTIINISPHVKETAVTQSMSHIYVYHTIKSNAFPDLISVLMIMLSSHQWRFVLEMLSELWTVSLCGMIIEV